MLRTDTPIPVQHLVGYWLLNARHRTNDLSVYGNHGTAKNGAAPVASRYGGAYEFVHPDETHILAPMPDLSADTHLSISAWVKCPDPDTDGLTEYSICSISDGTEAFRVRVNDDSPQPIIIRSAGDNDDGVQTIPVGNDLWHHVAVVWDQGTEWTVYVDGVKDHTYISTDTSPTTGTQIWIGELEGLGSGLRGYIREVAVWYDTLLSASQIRWLSEHPGGLVEPSLRIEQMAGVLGAGGGLSVPVAMHHYRQMRG